MRLIHCKIKIHIHEFYKCDKNNCQNAKGHYLLGRHDFDVFFTFSKS
jgi:Cu/Zn superoxide dismutase